MSDADKLIEAAAMAIINKEYPMRLALGPISIDEAKEFARAALSAIEASGTHVVANVEKWPTPEALASALETTDYKYFGDYTLSEGQWDAVTTLCVAARELLSARPRITGGTE